MGTLDLIFCLLFTVYAYVSIIYMFSLAFRDPEIYFSNKDSALFIFFAIGAFFAISRFLYPPFENLFSFIPESWKRVEIAAIASYASTSFIFILYTGHMNYRKLKKDKSLLKDE